MSLRTPTGSELRRENCVAMPRRRGGMDVAHVTTRRMPAMKPVGKPDAGNPHVRFDERGGETGCFGDTAPLLDSTVSVLTLPSFGGGTTHCLCDWVYQDFLAVTAPWPRPPRKTRHDRFRDRPRAAPGDGRAVDRRRGDGNDGVAARHPARVSAQGTVRRVSCD